MSYGLRGCDGRLHGLGYSYEELRASMGQESCSPFDTACVERASQVAAAANAFWLSDPHSGHNTTEDWPLPGNVPSIVMSDPGRLDPSGAPVFTPAPSGGGAAMRGGQVSFTSSRGGNALQVGDTWLVSITGASPNSPVTVSGSGPGGSFVSTPMGSTDSRGSWSKSGSVGAAEIGPWSELWAVGGVPSGSFSFTVSPVVAGAKSPGGTPAKPPGGGFDLPTVGRFDLSKVPWWGWLAAGAAAIFFVGGQRGR